MFCDTTKVKLHYEVSGSGAPLIMLHGSGEDISIFDRAVPLLEKHFTVYRIDSRCHGQSTMNVPLHYELIADDVYGFIVLNRIEKPIVYGFSDGGIAALMLAYTHPDAVRAIAASGANTNPKGLKPLYRFGYRKLAVFSPDPKARMIATEPNITAADLARIMKYCIMDSEKKDAFLELTRTESYQFSDCDGSGSYSCSNHNTFLHMMNGALSGKTGFTADAGYCYVGALREDDRTFIVALLACGWPNNKGYKWSDTRKLMEYALENYHYREFGTEAETVSVAVENGSAGGFPGAGNVQVKASAKPSPFRVLLKAGEEISVEYDVHEAVKAPIEKGQTMGTVIYSLGGETIREYPLTADVSVQERDFAVCFSYIRDCFLLVPE